MAGLLAGAAAAILSCGGAGGGGGVGGGGGSSFSPQYVPAGKGTPTGTAVTQTVDGSGGTVSSADRRLDLVIPAGALSAATQVAIQPITNTTPNGLLSAYRLLPEGTAFAQPVTLTFHLSDVQAQGIGATWIATQHADGLWYSQAHQARDAGGKTVSVTTKHFSDWSVAQTVDLTPQQARVRCSQDASFVPRIVAVAEDDDELANPSSDELTVPVPVPLNNQIAGSRSWQVNSVQGGDTTVGLVVDKNMTGEYTAPATPPTPDTVTVTLTLQLGKAKVIAPAQVTIFAQELWSGTSHINMTDGTVVDSTFTFEEISDSGGTALQFQVQSGTVHVKVPDTLPNGCTQTASPTDQDMGHADGVMKATYDTTTGPDSPMVAGMGTTVWLATYTVTCPNGTNSMPAGLEADWWPSPPGAQPTPVQATDGVFDDFITTPTASGNVHLIRQ